MPTYMANNHTNDPRLLHRHSGPTINKDYWVRLATIYRHNCDARDLQGIHEACAHCRMVIASCDYALDNGSELLRFVKDDPWQR